MNATSAAQVESAPLDQAGHSVHRLPVFDAAGTVIGIVTEGDLLRRAETGTERRRPRWVEFLLGPGRLAGKYVRSHMPEGRGGHDLKRRRGRAGDPVEEVVALMERHRIKRLPVLERGRLVGMITRANLLHALAVVAPAAPGPTPADAEILARLFAEIDRQPWVVVGQPAGANGVVGLYGTITDERERRAVCVAAENISGVKGGAGPSRLGRSDFRHGDRRVRPGAGAVALSRCPRRSPVIMIALCSPIRRRATRR